MAKKPTTSIEPTSAAASPATFETVARARVSTALDTYRAEVARAADGQPQTQELLERVLDALVVLGLPESAWAGDVGAMREYRKHDANRDAEEQAQPRYAEEARVLAKEIEAMEKLLAEKKAHLFKLNRRPMRMVAAVQRQEDLKRERPHLFLPVEVAVERIVGARASLKALVPGAAAPQFVPRVPALS